MVVDSMPLSACSWLAWAAPVHEGEHGGLAGPGRPLHALELVGAGEDLARSTGLLGAELEAAADLEGGECAVEGRVAHDGDVGVASGAQLPVGPLLGADRAGGGVALAGPVGFAGDEGAAWLGLGLDLGEERGAGNAAAALQHGFLDEVAFGEDLLAFGEGRGGAGDEGLGAGVGAEVEGLGVRGLDAERPGLRLPALAVRGGVLGVVVRLVLAGGQHGDLARLVAGGLDAAAARLERLVDLRGALAEVGELGAVVAGDLEVAAAVEVEGVALACQAAGELVAVDGVGGGALAQQLLVGEAVGLAVQIGEVGDEDVGVGLRVAGAAGGMGEGGVDQIAGGHGLVQVAGLRGVGLEVLHRGGDGGFVGVADIGAAEDFGLDADAFGRGEG